MARRSKDWQDRRRKRKLDDTEALDRIYTIIGDLPTYGYCRVWVLLHRQSETDDMVINAKRVYRIMRQNALLLGVNLQYRHETGTYRESGRRGK